MTLRSFLFVPGDSEKKLSKGDASGADALILDLEDSVAPSRKEIARAMVRDYLTARPAGA
jgi:citrate lyase subunit beta / citryl-CoA lyase